MVYIFQADTYCDDCGESIRDTTPVPAGADPDDETTWDSDDYPKGPFDESGESVDSPKHCANCEVLLDYDLTEEGIAYVVESIVANVEDGSGRAEILREWWAKYEGPIRDYWTEDDTDSLLSAVGRRLLATETTIPQTDDKL